MHLFAIAPLVCSMEATQLEPAATLPGVALAQAASNGGAGGSKPAAAGNPAASPSPGGGSTPAFGARDSWRWQLLGSWIGDFKGASQFEAEWSASWFFMQDVSMDFGLSGDAILQPGLDAGGGGASLMFRWHFLARQDWSLFADLGCGMLFTNEPVPSDGGRVNFTPRAGVGGTLAISPSARLMAGVRWYHISNANTAESNPGRDSMQVFGGLSFPF